MLELLLFVLVAIGAGYGLRKGGLVRPEAAKDLNAIVFHLTLPALLFLAVYQAQLSWSLLTLPGVAWIVVLIGMGIGWGLARAFKLPPAAAGALILAIGYGNTTFIGYPIVEGFYGREHLTYAIFFDQLGNTLAINTIGTYLASTMGGGSGSLRASLKRLAWFPPTWAVILGLLLNGHPLPGPALTLIDRLADLTVPLMMLTIGMSLQFRAWREDLPLVGVAAVARLVVVPLAAWGLARAFGMPLAYQQAVVMESAMPTMFYGLTLAMMFNLRLPLIVNTIMVTTLLSFATLPIWRWLLSL